MTGYEELLRVAREVLNDSGIKWAEERLLLGEEEVLGIRILLLRSIDSMKENKFITHEQAEEYYPILDFSERDLRNLRKKKEIP